MSFKVQTVLGDVSPERLGKTLTHEHLAMKFSHFYREPPSEIRHECENPNFPREHLGYIRQYPYSNKSNLLLNDENAKNAVRKDVKHYKLHHGGTIVENSTEGLERDIHFYKQVSEETGVHVVAGTGFYIEDVQEHQTINYKVEDMYNHMIQELTNGCVGYPEVKSGFMGEIASVWPIRDFERRAIKAAGEVQTQVRCGVSFHPHRDENAPEEILRIFTEAGGRADKAVMSHLDRTLLDPVKLLEFAELGSYCQFDLFGTEVSFYQLNVATDMPSDAQRINMIRQIVNEGKVDRVLMSHDIHTKHRLLEYGGHGYAHINVNVLPKMAMKGFSKGEIDMITITNPARWLAVPY
ncbi:phosphotriesterase-related protein [Danaus plexippus]|uniref:phosphotriesterase-related protein n=1 Tax=Danaus plexippus TaxID=13037 RepID=UPI002AB1F6D0|nr:phosphotriesterase-related protein [Danaus plexippus]